MPAPVLAYLAGVAGLTALHSGIKYINSGSNLQRWFGYEAKNTASINPGCALKNHLNFIGGPDFLNSPAVTAANFALNKLAYLSCGRDFDRFMGYIAEGCQETPNSLDYHSLTADYLSFLDTYLVPGLTFTCAYQVVSPLPDLVWHSTMVVPDGVRGSLLRGSVIIFKSSLVPAARTIEHGIKAVANSVTPKDIHHKIKLPDFGDGVIVACKAYGYGNMVANIAGEMVPYVVQSNKSTDIPKAFVKTLHQKSEKLFVEQVGDPIGFFAFGWTRKLAYDVILPAKIETPTIQFKSSPEPIIEATQEDTITTPPVNETPILVCPNSYETWIILELAGANSTFSY